MKINLFNARNFALALLLALFAVASMPQDSLAQRTKTDKGKVTVQRKKSATTPRSASKSGASKSRASGAASRSGAGKSKASGAASRSGAGKARASGAASRSGASQSKARGSDSRNGAGASAGSASRSNSDRSKAAARQKGESRSSQADRSSDRSRSDVNANSGRAGSRDRSVNSDRNRSGASSDRNVISGNRSRLNLPGKAHIVVKNRKNSVRFAPRIYVNAHASRAYRPSSRISIHVAWPWVVRYERHWSPRYRYRQVVYVESRWGGGDRNAQVEMETTYKHRVKFATDDYAVLDIEIEEVALYENGRFLGTIDRIPGSLSSVEATVYRDGRITFDRDVFIVGDRRAGFEMISTRFYDDYALARYKSSDGYRVGSLNLRTGKVSMKRRSRLFDPNHYRGFAPISLLPEEEGWLWDYGVDAISAASDDYDAYYGYNNGAGRGFRSGSALNSTSEYSYSTDFGAEFKVERSSNIQRVE